MTMTMKLSHEGLRKAAILVASLDTAAADAVLDQLTPEQARQVREIVVEMDDIDQGEQRRVIDEFFQSGPKVPATDARPASELDGRLAWLAVPRRPRSSPTMPTPPRRPAPAASPLPLPAGDRGRETGPRARQRAAANDRPGAFASFAGRAGAVLARLPEDVQVEVIHRLVDLEETDPEILREVEEALRSRLSQQVEMQRRRVAGLQAVAGILQATDGRLGMQILDNLASRDRALAEKLRFPPVAAIDVRRSGRPGRDLMAEVFDEAGPELMLPALFGAAPELVNRVLARLPEAARALRHKLDHPGPIRLRDVEEARRQVARIASRVNYRVSQQYQRSEQNNELIQTMKYKELAKLPGPKFNSLRGQVHIFFFFFSLLRVSNP